MLKRIALAAFLAAPMGAHAAEVTVSVTGLPQESGTLVVCLWSAPQGFPDCRNGKSVIKSVRAKEGAKVSFDGLANGTYAVSVLHDVNGDGKLGTNVIGIPTEPVGVSNNAPMRFGPPKFAAAAFPVDGNEAITIRVK